MVGCREWRLLGMRRPGSDRCMRTRGVGLVGGFGGGGGGWWARAGNDRVVRRGLCRGCSGLWVGCTGAVWMTVVCVVHVVGGVAGFLGVGAGIWMVIDDV